MAELTLRLVVDPATGRRQIVVDYRSDPDALPEEHEEAHRRLAEALGATEREPSAGSRSPGSAAIVEPESEPEGADVKALRFAGPDALAVALTTGLLPPATPGLTWQDGAAIVAAELPAEVLLRLGVPVEDPPPGGRAVAALDEALPLLPAPVSPHDVLFVEPPEGILALAAELLRLGCDRLSLCPEARAVRCRDAPEWVLSRQELRAYTPVTATLWVAAGWRLRIPTESRAFVVVDADGRRHALPDGPWHDAAAVTEIVVPPAPPALSSSPPPRLEIPLRLVATRRATAARLWVIPAERFPLLDELVATLDEPTLDVLELAIAHRGAERWAILRARRDVDLELGTPFAPLAEADLVHVPLGLTLAPRLWPTRLRAALAPRPDEIVWISPPFVVERLPESAFVPLSRWVDFVLEEAAPALIAWSAHVSVATDPDPVSAPAPAPAPAPVLRPRIPSVPRRRRPPDAALAALERRLLAQLDADPDSPELPALWRELALCHPDPREAALAYAHSVWHVPDPSPADFLAARPDLPASHRHALAGTAPVDDADLDVRTAWLAYRAAPFPELARARDRWLDRLRSGLALARDVPSVLRRASATPSADTRARIAALDELLELLVRAPRPDNPLEAPAPLTLAYVRLTVAHGFALLGDHERAAAVAAVELPADPLHDAVQALYRARRDELARAEESPPIAAPPPPLEDALVRYKLDRLRAVSGFLGGVDWIDPVVAFRRDPRAAPTDDLGRLACLAAWDGRIAEARSLAARLAEAAVADPADLRRTAATGRALAGTARGLARQGLAPPDAFHALLEPPPEDLARLVLCLPLAGVVRDDRPADAADRLLATASGEERLTLAAALAAFAAAEPADESRRVALHLAGFAPDVTDVLSTNTHFCLSLVRLAEAATSALAADGSPGTRQRARLDDDERRVRRRLHADFAALAPEEIRR